MCSDVFVWICGVTSVFCCVRMCSDVFVCVRMCSYVFVCICGVMQQNAYPTFDFSNVSRATNSKHMSLLCIHAITIDSKAYQLYMFSILYVRIMIII